MPVTVARLVRGPMAVASDVLLAVAAAGDVLAHRRILRLVEQELGKRVQHRLTAARVDPGQATQFDLEGLDADLRHVATERRDRVDPRVRRAEAAHAQALSLVFGKVLDQPLERRQRAA